MTSIKTVSFHPGIPADQKNIHSLDFGKPFTPQVEEFFMKLPSLNGCEVVGIPGQAVAIALTLPVLEMSIGLPKHVSLFGFGQETKVVGEFNLEDYRNNVVRPRREEQVEGPAFSGYTILDGGGRGMEPYQMEELCALLNTTQDNFRVVDVSMGHIDPANPEKGLADKLLATGLTKSDWISGRLLFVAPGFGPLVAVMITAIYAMSEVWPKTIRLNRENDGKFHVAEVVDAQGMRQFGVKVGARWAAGQAPVSIDREFLKGISSVLDELLGSAAIQHGKKVQEAGSAMGDHDNRELLERGQDFLNRLRALIQ